MRSRDKAETGASVDELLREAAESVEAGDRQAAFVAARTAIKVAPHDARAWTCMARVMGRHRHWQAAEKACICALEIDPEHPAAIASLGAISGTLGKWDEARAHFE